MFPCFATSTNPTCLGPCLCTVCVKVAATFLRAGCSISSDSNFFNSGLVDGPVAVDELLDRVVDLHQLLLMSDEEWRPPAAPAPADQSRPAGTKPPRPGPCVVAGGTLVCGARLRERESGPRQAGEAGKQDANEAVHAAVLS